MTTYKEAYANYYVFFSYHYPPDEFCIECAM